MTTTPVARPVSDVKDGQWFATNLVTVRAATEGLSVLQSRAAHGDMPPLHRHEEDDELFLVLEGELEVFVEGEEPMRLPAGSSIVAPHGRAHTFRVASEEGASWLLVLPSGRFAGFVNELSRPAERHEVPPRPDGPPPPEAQARFADAAARHGITVLGPPGTLPND